MDNTPESWLLLRTTLGHTHLPAEGTCQPITHFTWHWFCLQVAEFVLSIQQTPSRQTETPVSDSLERKWQRKWIYLDEYLFLKLQVYAVLPGLISVNSIQHGSGKLQVPAEFLQVHNTTVHLLQDPLQPGKANTYHIICAQLMYQSLLWRHIMKQVSSRIIPST